MKVRLAEVAVMLLMATPSGPPQAGGSVTQMVKAPSWGNTGVLKLPTAT